MRIIRELFYRRFARHWVRYRPETSEYFRTGGTVGQLRARIGEQRGNHKAMATNLIQARQSATAAALH